jgi:Ulp1 family protease catalytic subunit
MTNDTTSSTADEAGRRLPNSQGKQRAPSPASAGSADLHTIRSENDKLAMSLAVNWLRDRNFAAARRRLLPSPRADGIRQGPNPGRRADWHARNAVQAIRLKAANNAWLSSSDMDAFAESVLGLCAASPEAAPHHFRWLGASNFETGPSSRAPPLSRRQHGGWILSIGFLEAQHWVLLAVWIDGRAVVIIDSLTDVGRPYHARVLQSIDSRLREHWHETSAGTPLRHVVADVPQQPNKWECGFHTLAHLARIAGSETDDVEALFSIRGQHPAWERQPADGVARRCTAWLDDGTVLRDGRAGPRTEGAAS